MWLAAFCSERVRVNLNVANHENRRASEPRIAFKPNWLLVFRVVLSIGRPLEDQTSGLITFRAPCIGCIGRKSQSPFCLLCPTIHRGKKIQSEKLKATPAQRTSGRVFYLLIPFGNSQGRRFNRRVLVLWIS